MAILVFFRGTSCEVCLSTFKYNLILVSIVFFLLNISMRICSSTFIQLWFVLYVCVVLESELTELISGLTQQLKLITSC